MKSNRQMVEDMLNSLRSCLQAVEPDKLYKVYGLIHDTLESKHLFKEQKQSKKD